MPKIIEEHKREEMKRRILQLLSVDGRKSIGEIAKEIKTTKATAYNLFLETVKEYDLHFVPEINIEEIWKYEFLKLSRMHTKREMLEEATEVLPDIGFEEYIVLFKFVGKEPDIEKLIKAMGDSSVPQFVAKLRGEYGLIMYGVVRTYIDIELFLINLLRKFEKHQIIVDINKIQSGLGFFPLNSSLISKFNISDTYVALLLGLNDNGRSEFKDIAAKHRKEPQGIIYAMDRLKRIGILKRVTYYEGKPKNVVNAIVEIKQTNMSAFYKTRNKWFLDLVKSYENKHNEYVFTCNISSPFGGLLFMSFENGEELEKLVNKLKKLLRGVEIKYSVLTNTFMGHLAIRNMDMRYTPYYQYLETEKMVPRFDRREKAANIVVEAPDTVLEEQ